MSFVTLKWRIIAWNKKAQSCIRTSNSKDSFKMVGYRVCKIRRWGLPGGDGGKDWRLHIHLHRLLSGPGAMLVLPGALLVESRGTFWVLSDSAPVQHLTIQQHLLPVDILLCMFLSLSYYYTFTFLSSIQTGNYACYLNTSKYQFF